MLAGPPRSGSSDWTHRSSGPSELFTAFCFTCLALFPALIGIAHSLPMASLSLPLTPQTCCWKLLLDAELSSPIWL